MAVTHNVSSTNAVGVTTVDGVRDAAIARVHVITQRSNRVRIAVGYTAQTRRILGEMTLAEARALADTLTAALTTIDQEN
jgi:hypothetical protein